MKTSKPIATISYNTEKFLREKIYYWKKQGIIEYGMWILHQPDVDGDKAHYHVYLQPSKLIQTEDLINDSCELDPTNPEKPLKMTVFKSSETNNWILYALHDEKYLTEKGLSRNIHYEANQIESTCEDTFYEMLSCAFDYRNNKLEFRIIEAINQGQSWTNIVSSGMIPIRQMAGARLFYMALTGQDKMQ